MYKIVLLSEAEKVYKRLFTSNPQVFKRIYNALELLKNNPLLGKSLKDNLKGKYSLRVGVYRIIYSIEKNEVTICILDIGHRREIYR